MSIQGLQFTHFADRQFDYILLPILQVWDWLWLSRSLCFALAKISLQMKNFRVCIELVLCNNLIEFELSEIILNIDVVEDSCVFNDEVCMLVGIVW